MLNPGLPTVTVCRGCCCGTTKKHPRVDHAELQERLSEAVDGAANLRVTDCLGPCERSNVVVVSPARHARRFGRPTWFGYVLDADMITYISDWVRNGGPGLADHDTELDRHRFTP
jgi:(2Fe-2S) ferredoxin